MTEKKKILFTIGSPNQTTQMHQISQHLPEYDCYFSQHFGLHWFVEFGQWTGILDRTIIGEKSEWKAKADKYLEEHGLRNDYKGQLYNNKYELIIMCNDFVVPRFARKAKTMLVQEGMVDRPTPLGKLVKFLRMPGYWAFNTQLSGSSNKVDIVCAGSEGYKQHFIKMGVDKEKIIVTGIPNHDNAQQYVNNDFPYKDYVLVATSDIRECFEDEDRVGFIKDAVKIANGRRLIFKLHPHEVLDRATKEIKENTPADTLIFQEGNTNEMIANCEELITQYSTVVYTGMALGKKVHSFFPLEELQRNQLLQNGGRSAENIANIARQFIEFKGAKKEFLKKYNPDK